MEKTASNKKHSVKNYYRLLINKKLKRLEPMELLSKYLKRIILKRQARPLLINLFIFLKLTPKKFQKKLLNNMNFQLNTILL